MFAITRLGVKKKLVGLLFALIIIFPFIISWQANPIQSYPDFFIKGAHNSLSAYYGWSPENFGGNAGGSLWRLVPLSIFYTLFTNILGIPSGITQLFLCASLFIACFISYIKIVPKLLSRFELNDVAVKLTGLFYLFNTYTLVQLANSFLLVIPYLLLPVQILLLLKAFETKKFYKYAILLALLNAACFGINLIFDVINLIVLATVTYITLFRGARIKFAKLALFFVGTYSLTLALCSFWIVPQIYSSLIDPTTTQYVLKSEQFYSSDSSLTKVLRGLGEWSFFSGQNGIPYNSYASAFKSNLLVIVAGYIFPALAICAMFLFRDNRRLRKSLLLLFIALVLTFVAIGGTYPNLPTAHLVQMIFDKVPFATAFRNTYKFAAVEMLLICLLAVVTLTTFYNRLGPRRKLWTGMLTVLVVAFICINAFPFLTNQVYSDNTKINKIPDYWLSTAKTLNNQTVKDSGYIFMLPSQYFETLKWDGTRKNFSRNLEETLFSPSVVHNSCAGCGQYLTSSFLDYVYKNLSGRGAFKLLGLTGNSLVVQRNDFDWEYYKVQSPEKIKEILSSQPDVKKIRTDGKLDTYEINKQIVNPVFYSPNKLVATNSLQNFNTIANNQDKNTALALTGTIGGQDRFTLQNSNYYQPVFTSSNTTLSAEKAESSIETPRQDAYKLTASSKDPNYRVGYTSTNGIYTLKLQKLINAIYVNGQLITPSKNDTTTISLGSYGTSPIVIEIQKRSFLLEPNKSVANLGNFSFNSGASAINIYSTQNLGSNLAPNGSLENGLWQKNVLNCAKSTATAQINMKLIKEDASDGNNSLVLSAKDDTACTYTPALSKFEAGTYFFSFDSKRIKGSLPSYCVWSGKQCVAYSQIDAGSNWTPYSQAVYLDSEASNFFLYLYAQKANYVESQSQYDNVQIYHLSQPVGTVNYSLLATEDSPQTINLKAGEQTFQTDLTLNSNNLIDNGDFNNGPWQSQVRNCTDQSGGGRVGMKVVKDPQQGKAIELVTDGSVTACTYSAYIRTFRKGETYLVELKYKIVQGKTAKICIWNGRGCILSKTYTANDHNWHTVRELVTPGEGYQPLSTYLYAPAGDKSTVVQYADISMRQVENSFINSYTIANENLHTISTAKVSYTRQNPTHYNANLTSEDLSLLVFSQSYHPGWKAYMVKNTPTSMWQRILWDLGLWKRYSIPSSQHIVANGFSNGWWINPSGVPKDFHQPDGRYKLVVHYSPQRWVDIGLVVSGTALVSCIWYLTHNRWRKTGKRPVKYDIRYRPGVRTIK